MIRAKVCLLGAPGVGKSSLVRRFVHSIFSDQYSSTIGVAIERKVMVLGSGEDITMIIWDVHGESEPLVVPDRYLRGVSGYLLVADATRPETAATAATLGARVTELVGPIPHLVVWNKVDLVGDDRSMAEDPKVGGLADAATATIFTSAKTGFEVESAFQWLAEAMAPSN